MSPLRSLVLVALAAAALAPAGVAQQRREQDAARDALRAGQVKSLREIEARVLPRMSGADYLGPEYDAPSSTYRLKFMRNGAVIWIDVDARTGQIVGRSGD